MIKNVKYYSLKYKIAQFRKIWYFDLTFWFWPPKLLDHVNKYKYMFAHIQDQLK